MKALLIIFAVNFMTFITVAQKNLPISLIPKYGENKVEVLAGGKPFTAYTWPSTLKKPVLWPVVSPAGNVITRSFPMAKKAGERADHPHHVGIWLNFGDVNGLDFWNNSEAIAPEKAKNYGTILHKSVDKTKVTGKGAELAVTCAWVDINGKELLVEQTSMTFTATEDVRIIDRVTKLKAVNGDVKFTDNKEGMFAIRVTTELELPAEGAVQLTDAQGNITRVEKPDLSKVTGDYLSSEGITGGDVWGTRGTWMRLAGKINNEEVSVVIIDHPQNPGYPTYWHARGYGLFAANTLGQKPLSNGKDELNYMLRNGQTVTFRYRLVVTSGKPSPETIQQWTKGWSKVK